MRVPMRPPTLDDVEDWDKLRHLPPPDGLTHGQWWYALKLARRRAARPLPTFPTLDGAAFTYSVPDPALEMLHRIDQLAGGSIAIGEVVTNPVARDRYLVSSLIDEAITSSQLEGARTSYAVAQELLRSGRRPHDRSEQMIVNNYAAMAELRERCQEPLSPGAICELHRIVTQHTLLHTPPPAEDLPQRLTALCEFANGGGVEGFIHPVLRAIVVHFWLAHDHPFVDGNGRTARALFYWSMLREGYWLAEFLSISRIFKAAPAKYARAFTYVETDEGDLTYFLLHHLSVICRAIDELQVYVARKVQEVAATERLLRDSDLNRRQVDLLSHALRHPGATYSFIGHARSHRVVHQTARTDLLELEARGLLRKQRRGRVFEFRPVGDLGARVRA